MGETKQATPRATLLPDLQSLTDRALGPAAHLVPARRIEPLAGGVDEGVFTVHFSDGSTAPLRIQALAVAGGAWRFDLGNRGRHDLCLAADAVALDIVTSGDRCMVKAGGQTFNLNLSNGSFTLSDGAAQRTIVASEGPDLSVGDIPGSYALFRHQQGFGLSLGIGHQERLYGGGEAFGNFVKNGTYVDLRNCDALGVNGPAQYQATPYFWSSGGWGLALLSAAPSRADLGWTRHDVLTLATTQDGLSLLLQGGGSPAERWQQMRELAGPPRGVPDWSLGLWLSRCFYQDQREVEAVLLGAKAVGIHTDVINLDARCWMRANTRTDFVWDESRFEPYTTFIPRLRQQGTRVCLWENPYVSSQSELYAEGVAKGYFATAKDGSPYPLYWVPTGLAGFPMPPVAGLVDFTNPAACAWWKDLHRPFLRSGVSCFKTDFGEEIPADAHFADGSTGWELRNVYADLYNLCVTEVLEEELGADGIVWARSGWFKVGNTPVKWGGDSQSTWRALRASLRGGLSQAIGGALFWSHDVGGFYGPAPEPELFLRWAQVGLWGSHVRLHGTTPREPWLFGAEVLKCFRQALKVRQHLLPYFLDVSRRAVTTGSVLRPMLIAAPDDPACLHLDDQFMVGEDLLIAPFLGPEGGRSLYLPAGRWFDLRRGGEETGGRFLRTERSEHAPAYARVGSKFSALFAGVVKILNSEEA